MLKVFRDGLALDMSKIIRIRVKYYGIEEDCKYIVEALLSDEKTEILEYFATQEEAEKYVMNIVDIINYWENK